ncbi:unnamed protein product [Arabidopsis arenosa]|uniref:Uncharacterized protein n=1 Tax=Arabidopsis arenosa TaxID=38785 RepID=A0A8S1ZMT4_ARAAE|nr:unnamed protein product [Arabidopsis arenosa]
MDNVFLIIFSIFFILQYVRGFDFEERELQSEASLDQLYERWMKHYSVERIPGSIERGERFNVFKDTVMFVHETKNIPYNLKLNKFADMTFKEFSNIYANCNSGYDKEASPNASGRFMYENVTQLSDSFDWREEGAVSPVKDQKECSVEGISQIKTKTPIIPLSAQELVDCVTNKKNGCEGGFMDRAFDFITRNGGITTEQNYPYKGLDENCQTPKKSDATIDWYEEVPKNEDALLKAVANQPVSVAIDADNPDFMTYTGGVYNGTCGKNLSHAMTVVGYGSDSNQTKFWIVKNSYGVGWGEAGYIRMERGIKDHEGLCGIAMDAWYPIKYKFRNPFASIDEDHVKDEL